MQNYSNLNSDYLSNPLLPASSHKTGKHKYRNNYTACKGEKHLWLVCMCEIIAGWENTAMAILSNSFSDIHSHTILPLKAQAARKIFALPVQFYFRKRAKKGAKIDQEGRLTLIVWSWGRIQDITELRGEKKLPRLVITALTLLCFCILHFNVLYTCYTERWTFDFIW